MNRQLVMCLTLAIVIAALATNCGRGPSDPTPSCIDSIAVLVNDPAYTARTEQVEPIPVRLTKDCSRNSRYCYYLSDSNVGVYTGGNQTILDPYVGRVAVISGKVVREGGTSEVWAGTICRVG